jgi:hypothetical protein
MNEKSTVGYSGLDTFDIGFLAFYLKVKLVLIKSRVDQIGIQFLNHTGNLIQLLIVFTNEK